MNPAPPSTISSPGTGSPETPFRIQRRRNRVPVSCQPCRVRKKCDRLRPCTACVNRGSHVADGCTYATSSPGQKKGQTSGPTSPDEMQDRIVRLESLVLSLMHGAANINTASLPTAAAAATAPGRQPAVALGSGARSSTSSVDCMSLPGLHGGADMDTSPSSIAPMAAMAGRWPAALGFESQSSSSAGGHHATDDCKMNDAVEDNPRNTSDEDDDNQDSDGGDDSKVDADLSASLGLLKINPDNGAIAYLGHEHWHAILGGLAEVKSYFAANRQELTKGYARVLSSKSSSSLGGPALLLGTPPTSAEELRNELPSRSTVAALCTRFLSTSDHAASLIHAPVFMAQLSAHWQDPSRTSIMWLGLLYSVMCMAMQSYYRIGDVPPAYKDNVVEMAAKYQMRTAQCLVIGDFTTPGDHTVETMLFYLCGEQTSRFSPDFGLWLVSAIIIRTAFRMGYHRDPKWFPSLTPFQAEMRRRVWAFVRIIDATYSNRLSLPTMIYDHTCDTQPPRNLFDADFGPATKILPPSRPIEEDTPILYILTKGRFCIALSNILDSGNVVGKQIPYEETLRFDAQLREMRQALPPHLKLDRFGVYDDPARLVAAQFGLEILYQKIICLIHRRYLTRSDRLCPAYAYSHHTAIEASLLMLEHLSLLRRESQPGGRFQEMKWQVDFMATRDFLPPAMIIMLDLHFDNTLNVQAGSPRQHRDDIWTPARRLDVIRRLEETRDIMEQMSGTSIEAIRAHHVLAVILGTLEYTPAGEAGRTAAAGMGGVAVPRAETETCHGQAGATNLAAPSLLQSAQLGMPPAMADPALPGPDRTLGSAQDPADAILGSGQEPASFFSDFSDGMFGMVGASSGLHDAFFNQDPGLDPDWDAIENYTQTTNWGTYQTFPMFTVPHPQNGTGYEGDLSSADEVSRG